MRALILILIMIAGAAQAGELEIDMQAKFCDGMLINRQLPNHTEVDCVTDRYAIEVDFTDHWAAAIGQSLSYAATLERRPGIILVCNSDTRPDICLRHRLILQETIRYWNIGVVAWYCDSTDPDLEACMFEDFFGPE